MQVVKSYIELDALNLPIQHKQSLAAHITEAFNGDLSEMQKSWDEIGITLILIEEGDTDHDLSLIDGQTQSLIDYVIAYPEYVLIIEPWVIGLAVLNDHGSGCFLVGHSSNTSNPVRQLLSQVSA